MGIFFQYTAITLAIIHGIFAQHESMQMPSTDPAQTPQTGPWKVGNLVQTSSGAFTGRPAARNKEVSEYLGIRYAMAPVGDLRFMPPMKFPGHSHGETAADEYSGDCPSKADIQPYTRLPAKAAAIIAAQGQVNHTFSEDCLTLNIWTKPQTGEKKKAVLLWIHGGGFNIGSGSQPAFDGSTMAENEDVIIVTFNYRLNIFGFPTAPGLVDQNPGLLDVRMAVEWVRDNIANFGGDPARITLFGESAGGIAVDLYTYAFTADPIINGFIAQSGTALLRVTGVKVGDYSQWHNVSKNIGCGGAESNSTMECMRGKSIEEILAGWTRPGDYNKPQPFGIYPDNRTVFPDYFNRGRKGMFVKRPILFGHNDLESGLFRFLSERVGTVNEKALAAIDEGYACPPAASANYRVTRGIKAWRYRYQGVFPNQEISPKAGAYHSAEIPLLFGTSSDTGPDTPQEVVVAKGMRHAWAEFAKDPVNGLSKLGWPIYAQDAKTLVQLGYQNNTQPVFEYNNVYDEKCPSYVKESLTRID